MQDGKDGCGDAAEEADFRGIQCFIVAMLEMIFDYGDYDKADVKFDSSGDYWPSKTLRKKETHPDKLEFNLKERSI